MRPTYWLFFAMAAALPTLTGARAPADAKETIRRTLAWPRAGAHTVEVSNIDGPIRLVGYEGTSVEMSASRTIVAETESALKEARTKVRLETTASADLIRICADAERCGCGDRHPKPGRWQSNPFHVSTDFEVRVPRSATIRLCTVNHGDITVEGISGEFDATNVNGAIHMTAVRGSGRAITVNGPVRAAFDAAPRSASTFKTVNGEIEVRFPRDLSADLKLKTVNGGIYTDFDVSPLPASLPQVDQQGGMRRYRVNRFAHVRAGSGGPELTFEDVNGDVRVLRRDD